MTTQTSIEIRIVNIILTAILPLLILSAFIADELGLDIRIGLIMYTLLGVFTFFVRVRLEGGK